MSAAILMGSMTRRWNYAKQLGYEDFGGMPRTPRQRCRYRRKLRRQVRRFLAGDGHYPGERLKPSQSAAKGRPTPRQRKRETLA